MGFDQSRYDSFCNAVVRMKSIIGNYNGTYIGSCREVINHGDGNWPVGQSIGVLLFANGSDAKRWTYSDPTFRNQDFLDQIEMYAIPLGKQFPSGQKVIQMISLRDVNEDLFLEDYLASVTTLTEQQHGHIALAATGQCEKVKGLRSPGYVIINAFPSAEALQACEAKMPNDIKRAIATGDNVVAELCSRSAPVS